MTNRIALVLGLFVLAFLAVDLVVFGGGGTIAVLRLFIDLIDFAAFWR
ncbi:MAG: hypothetical protein R3D84_13875 [Paracoccaceae bacterium]